MKRGGPLRRDPEKARAWRQRSKPLKRKPRKKRPSEGPCSPLEYKRAVRLRAEGYCAVCGRLVPLWGGEAHHPLAKRELRARRLYEVVYDPDNGAWLCLACHEAHENGSRRIYRDELPATVLTFCAALGSWAQPYVERSHPQRKEQP